MSEPSVYFDRQVPEELLKALEPGGAFHDLVEAVKRHPDEPLDLQLRCRAGSSPHATLYLGLTKAIQLRMHPRRRFSLAGQETTRTFARAAAPWREDWAAWRRPRSLEKLDSLSRDKRAAYIDAIVEFAREGPSKGRYVTREGALQTALSRFTDRFVVVDREAVIGFREGSEAAHVNAARDRVADAIDLLRSDPGGAWTFTRAVRDSQHAGSRDAGRKAHNFGGELDALAVDGEGQVLVIEAKDGSDTGGVGWTPAQVAVYLRLFMAWADAAGHAAADALEGMLSQRRRLGLTGDPPRVVRPLRLVPVIAIGSPVRNPRVANSRMDLVRGALAQVDEPLTGLQVLQVTEDASLRDAGVGGLV